MLNYVQPGNVLQFTAPVGGVTTSQAYMIGGLLVVAAETKAAGQTFRGVATGVFSVPKPEEVWTEGEKVYVDADASPEAIFTITEGSPALPLVGVAVRASALSLAITSDDTDSPPALTIAVSGAGGTIAVDAYASLTGDVLTVTINGTAHTVTEGTDYDAETSDPVTATNLGAALAKLPGLTVAVTDDDITLTVDNPSTTGYVRLDGVAR